MLCSKSIIFLIVISSNLCTTLTASLPKSIIDNKSLLSPRITEEPRDFNPETWEPSKELVKLFPYYLSGYDEDDRPIVIMELGKWNVVGWYERGEEALTELDRHALKLEYIVKSGSWNRPSTTLKNNITKEGEVPKSLINEMIGIIDFDGLDISQARSPAAIAFMIKYMAILDGLQHRVRSLYFINVNAVASVLIRILKPTLGRIFERVEVYGTIRSRWIPILRRSLPEDQIPEKYGGRKGHKPLIFYG